MKTNRSYRMFLTVGLALCLALAGCDKSTNSQPPPMPEPTKTSQPTLEPTVSAERPDLSSNVSTYAKGLIYPRGLKFGPDGYLYVAESGTGGEIESMGTCPDYTSMFAPYQIGMTSQVSRLSPDGTRAIVVGNLPAARDQFGDVLGVSDIAFIGDTLYAVVSGGGCSRGFADFPASILMVKENGTFDRVANLSQFFIDHPAAAGNEEDYEPDGSANAVVAYEGRLYIVNANHGTLDEITPNGQVRRLLDITATEGHVTPAALAIHDGNFYVGALGKFPIQTGTSKVYQVTPDGEMTIFADGLTAIVGLAFDGLGRLYVLEASSVNGDYPAPGAGRVVRLTENGALEEIASGLSFPMGLTFGPDGALYASNFGYGGDPTLGEVVRIEIAP